MEVRSELGYPERWQSHHNMPSTSQISELAADGVNWNGSPDWHMAMLDIHLQETQWMWMRYYCHGHAGVEDI